MGDVGAEAFAVADDVRGEISGERDGIAVEIEDHGHRDLALQAGESQAQCECQPGDGLGSIEVPVEDLVADRCPAQFPG